MKRLNLSEWSQVAEIVGTVAVVTTLIFVGLQIRQNTSIIQSTAAQAVHENFAGWYSSVQNSPELLSLSVEGMKEYSSLSGVERAQFIAMFMSFCSYTQNAFYKREQGSLSSDLWRGWELVAMNFFSTSGGKFFWKERGYLFSDAFQDYVNEDLMTREPHPLAKPWGAFPIDESKSK